MRHQAAINATADSVASSRRTSLGLPGLWVVVGSVLFWTALGVFFAAQMHFAGLPWRTALEWSLPRWYSWGLVTPAIFWLDRQLAGRLVFGWRLAVHAPLAIAWTLLVISLRLITRPLRGAAFPADVWSFVADRFGPDLTIYAVIGGVSLVTAYTAHLRTRAVEAQERADALERRLSEARLHNLRAQLQPHFLFNTLNTISAFTEAEPAVARRLIARLGDLLRASLTHTSRTTVPLAEEFTMLDDYLAIEGARFGDRIEVVVRIDDGISGSPVPSFLLQPLVENALRHGVGPRQSGGRVEVSAVTRGTTLLLRVADNGLGLPGAWHLETHAGVGLSNLRDRLAQLYGRNDLPVVAANPAGGVTVEVSIPPASAG